MSCTFQGRGIWKFTTLYLFTRLSSNWLALVNLAGFVVSIFFKIDTKSLNSGLRVKSFNLTVAIIPVLILANFFNSSVFSWLVLWVLIIAAIWLNELGLLPPKLDVSILLTLSMILSQNGLHKYFYRTVTSLYAFLKFALTLS